MEGFNEFSYLFDYLGVETNTKAKKKKKENIKISHDETLSIMNKACSIITQLLFIEVRDVNKISTSLDLIFKQKQIISNLSIDKRNDIVNLCVSNNKDLVTNLLDQYNIIVFLKTTIKLLEEDKHYKAKVFECKKNFKDKEFIDLVSYLYKNGKTSLTTLQNNGINESISENELKYFKKEKSRGNFKEEVYSLTPFARNLFAFYLNEIKYIYPDNKHNEINEEKLNQVLEYLIDCANSNKKKSSLPKIYSQRTQSNIDRLKSIIINQNKFTLGMQISEPEYESEYIVYKQRRFE